MTRSLEALQQDFLNLKFGMFIHYNMATYKGVQWVDGYPDPSTFDPGGPVDTDAWADAAVAAGMTYAVLTAKHVGGFCLWDSRYTTYGVMHPDCPYPEELVSQFVRSFTERGLKVGLYYCWRNPGFDDGDNRGKHKVLPPECDPATHSLDEQIDFQKKQIAELVERYPEVSYIWNDGLDPTIMPAEEAQAFMRSLGPDIIASANWWDWGKKGMPYLDLAVPTLRTYKLSTVPQGLTEAQARTVLASVDRSKASGRRDYAILQLLHAYGVRGGQVRGLRLNDIGWTENTILFRAAKNGKDSLLPLTEDVAASLLDYLRHARPRCSFAEVFLTCQAPYHPLLSPGTLSTLVANRIRAAGIDIRKKGSHTFRHGFATRMVAKGHSLKAVADVLGHRHLSTTFIYTKVDFKELRQVALDWPEEVSA